MQEILPTIVTAIITLVATLVGFCAQTIIQVFLNKKGSVKIYRKLVYRKNSAGETWGFSSGSNGVFLSIPLWIEIHNTKNVTEVIRNFNISLYKDNQFVRKMKQMSHYSENKDDYHGNHGSYSFILAPKSISKFDLQFMLSKKDIVQDFDELRISYYDSSDKERVYKFEKIISCWKVENKFIDDDWKLIKK